MFRDAICNHEERVFLYEELIGLEIFHKHGFCFLVQCVLFFSLWSRGLKADTPMVQVLPTLLIGLFDFRTASPKLDKCVFPQLFNEDKIYFKQL